METETGNRVSVVKKRTFSEMLDESCVDEGMKSYSSQSPKECSSGKQTSSDGKGDGVGADDLGKHFHNFFLRSFKEKENRGLLSS